MLEKIKKVSGMGPGELCSVLYKKADKQVTKWLFYKDIIRPLPVRLSSIIRKDSSLLDTPDKSPLSNVDEEIFSNFLAGYKLIFYSFGESGDAALSAVKEQTGKNVQKVIRKADRICQHTLCFFNEDYKLGDIVDWSIDFTTGKKWPMIFYSDIPYRGVNKVGDIKYPWELSRHQYFITLGKAYWYSGDEKYAGEFVEQTRSWINNNPLYRGVHWISALEHAIRVISWIWAFHFFKKSSSLTPEFFSMFVRSIWTQLKHIEKNLTPARYANNHLIGEAAGLFIGGLFLSDMKRSHQWIETGKNILIREIENQTHPDGVNVEQAINYQRFVMDFFVLFKILHEQNIGPLPAIVDNRLEKMFEFLMYAVQPDGRPPAYGDSDNARGIALAENDSDYRGILSVGAALYKRADMKWVAKAMSEEVPWLLGVEGIQAYEAIESQEPAASSRLFGSGGYCILRDTWDKDAHYLLFDCGPLGYRTGAHGHADALSFQLFSYGGEMLVDSGTFAYNQDPEYRNYFRSTRAHNTVSVDGKDQAEMTDRMAWDIVTGTVIRDCYFSEHLDMISAEHNGYERLPFPVTHQRTVIFFKDPVYCLLIDHLASAGTHEYALHYHFPPGSVIKGEDPVAVSLSINRSLSLRTRCSSPVHKEIEEGRPGGMGWYSRVYGQKTASPSLTFRCNSSPGSTFFHTFLIPSMGDISLSPGFKVNAEGESVSFIIERDGVKDTWIINPAPAETHVGDILFYGRTGVFQQRSDGSLLSAYGRESTRLRVDGKSYLETGSPINGYIVNNIESRVK